VRETSDEYVWHFRLRDDGGVPDGGDEALVEMVHQQVSALLRCIQFTSDGRDVTVTGFRFLDDASREHRIRSALADAASPGAD
jgi:hypothetical protein